LEYTSRFLQHYGFYGWGYIIPIIFWRRLSAEVKSLWFFVIGYTLYIVLIGGDVLKVHRFFLPIFGLHALISIYSISFITGYLKPRHVKIIIVPVFLGMLAMTYFLPRTFVRTYNRIEKDFTYQMAYQARQMKKWDQSDFSVALPTIGIFGYELPGHRIIDMLGLTDSTIARYSEEPIPGMQTTWKETKHNSKYLLECEPDYIVFSTGIKPSAPAEKALLLYPQFLQSYRAVGWYYEHDKNPGSGFFLNAFKKMRPVEKPINPVYPVEYVEYYKKGLEASFKGDDRKAISLYEQSLRISPEPYYLDLLYQKANSHVNLEEYGEFITLLNLILESDSSFFHAHKDLYSIALMIGDNERAEIHRRWLIELVPWYVPRLDSIAAIRMSKLNK
jgi:tetratricopeptide (TPR) repeat protein